PSITIDTACSSSLIALHSACLALQNNECSMAFVNGINLLLSSYHYRYFSSLEALSATGRCHTFDERADGYVPGEAITSVLLKPLEQALIDGDSIQAVIKGSAVRHGGYTPSITAPSVEGESNVIVAAWKAAKINPESLGYIEAHGTGTKLGDPIEIQALIKSFKRFTDKKDFCVVGSAKAHIGHTEGAAGLTGIIKATLSLQQQEIPALPQFKTLNPYIKLNNSALRINKTTESWPAGAEPRRAGVSSFGFGGAYAHVVLEEAPTQVLVAQETIKPYYLVALSAKTEQTLQQKIVELFGWITDKKSAAPLLSSISYTLNMCREHFDYRCAVVVSSTDELQRLLEKMQTTCQQSHVFVGNATKQLEDKAIYDEVLDGLLSKLKLADYANPQQYAKQLRALANLYIKGYDVDWDLLHQSESQQKLAMPTYPFAKERYWLFDNFQANNQGIGQEHLTDYIAGKKITTANNEQTIYEFTCSAKQTKFLNTIQRDDMYYVQPGGFLNLFLELSKQSIQSEFIKLVDIKMYKPLCFTLDESEKNIQVNLNFAKNSINCQSHFQSFNRKTDNWFKLLDFTAMPCDNLIVKETTQAANLNNKTILNENIDSMLEQSYAKITRFMKTENLIQNLYRHEDALIIELGLDVDFFIENPLYSGNILDFIFSLLLVSDASFDVEFAFPVTLNIAQAIFPVKYFYPKKIKIESVCENETQKQLLNVTIYNENHVKIAYLQNISILSYYSVRNTSDAELPGLQYYDRKFIKNNNVIFDLDDKHII
ncbi:MAG: hypothetical protein JKY13_03245, partial [Gammaproteobacteria bacterium]|nr:hypothetical protein [Gammaproteobacteria bacterium]